MTALQTLSMSLAAAVLVLVLAVPASAAPVAEMDESTPLYSPTPAGHALSHCIHTVPSGSELTRHDNGSVGVRHEQGEYLLPRCDNVVDGVALPVVLGRGQPAPTGLSEAHRAQLPASYNGWLEYTAFNSSTPFDSFLGDFSVPNKPARRAQVVYLFTGLQNKDWVPKVDPESQSKGFDIIQPVLQYPALSGDHWSVRSWYVTLDGGVMVSDEVELEVGDTVFGNMTQTGKDKWFVGSTSVKTGKSTTITVNRPRLEEQLWAYNVLEAYGVTGCDQYPTNDCVFTNLALTAAGKPVTPTWLANPKPQTHHECKESIAITSPTSVSIHFQ